MQFHFITSNPQILNGKPITTGSRISGEINFRIVIHGSYAARFSKNEILLEYEMSS